MCRIIGVIILGSLFFTQGFTQNKEAIGNYEDVLKKLNENNNLVDSLGRKQGFWTEYKLLPSETIENATIPALKEGDTVLIVYDKNVYDKNCFIITCKGNYLDNLKTGKWIEYFPNDSIKSEIEYNKGIPYGQCMMYWGNGQEKIKCTIDSDFKIPVVGYDENGNVIIEKEAEKNSLIKAIYEE